VHVLNENHVPHSRIGRRTLNRLDRDQPTLMSRVRFATSFIVAVTAVTLLTEGLWWGALLGTRRGTTLDRLSRPSSRARLAPLVTTP
jgi:hypothetical protein